MNKISTAFLQHLIDTVWCPGKVYKVELNVDVRISSSSHWAQIQSCENQAFLDLTESGISDMLIY